MNPPLKRVGMFASPFFSFVLTADQSTKYSAKSSAEHIFRLAKTITTL